MNRLSITAGAGAIVLGLIAAGTAHGAIYLDEQPEGVPAEMEARVSRTGEARGTPMACAREQWCA